MQNGSCLELGRDCPAIQVPAGNTVTLPAGTTVEIVQSLGGSYTVRALDGIFTIQGRDADALGLAPAAGPAGQSAGTDAGPLTEPQVWAVLKQCFDPEIPLNIVDLGLIYDVVLEHLPAGGAAVEVKMTLTAPGCGMGPVIAADAEQKIRELPGVRSARVDVVWDPPWHQSMITAEGRRVLGLE